MIASGDCPDSTCANAKLACQCFCVRGLAPPVPANVTPSDFKGLSLTQLSTTVRIAFCVASLFSAVRKIVLLCSQPKMIWANTARIVSAWTVVANALAFRHWSKMQNPRGDVSANRHRTMPYPADLTVTKGMCGSSPQPAGFSFVDLRPKALWETVRKSLRGEILRSNFDLHKSVCLICVALPARQGAGAIYFQSLTK